MNNLELWEWIEQNAQLSFSRSGGPGGQYVNTADTKVTLHLPLNAIPLPDMQKQRLLERMEGRINSSGELVMHSSETRSQGRNRELVLERTYRMILAALVPVKKRRPTRPTRASQERRLKRKKTRSEKKQLRKDPPV